LLSWWLFVAVSSASFSRVRQAYDKGLHYGMTCFCDHFA
jgi:hypothetical protein